MENHIKLRALRLLLSMIAAIALPCIVLAEQENDAPTTASAAPASFTPDPEVQRRLADLTAGNWGGENRDGREEIADLYAATLRLREEVDDNERLVMEVLYHCDMDPSNGPRKSGLCILLKWLVYKAPYGIGDSTVLDAVLPYLDSPDAELREKVEDLLALAVESGPDAGDGFNRYRSHIRLALRKGTSRPRLW